MASEIERFVCPHCGGTFYNQMLGLMRESKLVGGSMVVMTSNPNESRPCPLCGREIPFEVLFAPPPSVAKGKANWVGLVLVAAAVAFIVYRCSHG